MKKVNLAIAAVTASTLFGSIAVMAPQASAVQPTREVVPAASSTLPKLNLSPDCIQALKDEGKLSTEIKKQLLIAGLSAKDAARAVDLETWDGGQTGPTLLQGVA